LRNYLFIELAISVISYDLAANPVEHLFGALKG